MLLAQTSLTAKQMVEMSISESLHRLEFLEAELRKLTTEPQTGSVSNIAQASSIASLNMSTSVQESTFTTRFGTICVMSRLYPIWGCNYN